MKIDPKEIDIAHTIQPYEAMTREQLIECCRTHDLHHEEHHKRERRLLKQCKAYHKAIDWLIGRVFIVDNKFRPSKSFIWPTVVSGNKILREYNEAD